MNKLIHIIIINLFIIFFSYPEENIKNSTILVIIEEQENDKFVTDDTPFSDGIFNALWEKENIFFDMKINTPIKMDSDQLNAKSYIETATDSGADVLLLIKFHYYTSKEKQVLKLIEKEYQYNLYSTNSMKSLSSGGKKLTFEKVVDSNTEKNIILKKTGYDLLYEIFSNINQIKPSETISK